MLWSFRCGLQNAIRCWLCRNSITFNSGRLFKPYLIHRRKWIIWEICCYNLISKFHVLWNLFMLSKNSPYQPVCQLWYFTRYIDLIPSQCIVTQCIVRRNHSWWHLLTCSFEANANIYFTTFRQINYTLLMELQCHAIHQRRTSTTKTTTTITSAA